jgi:hypothetical protein
MFKVLGGFDRIARLPGRLHARRRLGARALEVQDRCDARIG